MPSKSEDQRRLVYAKRSQYKTKKNTPKDWQWVWNDNWLTIKEGNMKRYKRYTESTIATTLKKFDGSDKSYKILVDWINSLNLKTGKAPSGLAKQYQSVLFIKKQIDVINEYYKGIPSSGNTQNIKATLQHLSIDDIEKLSQKLSKESKGTEELKLKNAIYYNHSIISEANFIKEAKKIDTFLSTLKGFHKKTLVPELKIYFVKKEMSKAKATYKSKEDVIYIRPDKITSGDKYASFNYVICHELGHRYLAYHNQSFNYDSSEWITTPYSKVDSMTGEEKFAELFALSHFNYKGKPFDDYVDKIEKFENIIK